jgi:hypothetical protein
MTLKTRKIIVIGIIAAVFVAGNVLVIANWLTEKGVPEKADWILDHFLTGTAITVILALVFLLVNSSAKNKIAIGRTCPVCDKRLFGNPNYCPECGSQVA